MTPEEKLRQKLLTELLDDAGTIYLMGVFERVLDCWTDYNDRLYHSGESIREDMGEIHQQLCQFRDCFRELSKLEQCKQRGKLL